MTQVGQMMRKIDMFIIHCSATGPSQRCTVQDIDRWHRQRGFAGIGYHYVIYRDGTIVKGRPDDVVGAHCKGHNSHSIGICYVGGLDADGRPSDTRTPEQKTAMSKLIIDLKKRYPGALVRSHRDFAAKECPCFDATTEYRDL